MSQAVETFKKKANKLKDELKLTEKVIEERSGIKQSSVNKYLRGKKKATVDTIEKFAKAFGTTAAALIAEGPLPTIVTRQETDAEILKRLEAGLRLAKLSHLPQEIVDLIASVDPKNYKLLASAIEAIANPEKDASKSGKQA